MGVLLLVRHGQASFGAKDYDVLSTNGFTQARRVGERLGFLGTRPVALIHGGLRRQRDTAEIMVKAAGWDAPVEFDPGWEEFDHLAVIRAYPALSDADRAALKTGTMDRRTFQQVFERATSRWASGSYDDDYPESYAGFVTRVRDALARGGRRCGPRTTAIVVTSGGPIAAAAAMLTQVGEEPRRLSASWQRFNAVVVNGSVTRVVVGSSGARLLTFNEHSYIDSHLVTYR